MVSHNGCWVYRAHGRIDGARGELRNLLAAVVPVAGGLIGMWLNHMFQMRRDAQREKTESDRLRGEVQALSILVGKHRGKAGDRTPLLALINTSMIQGKIVESFFGAC